MKKQTLIYLIAVVLLSALEYCQTKKQPVEIYKDPSQTIEARVNDLVSKMTLEEKVSQMVFTASAIPRLDIPAYNWWNEGLHGVARAGLATVFPQAIGLAAMWDTAQMLKVSSCISDEARAKYHEFIRKNKRGIYEGLTYWSPNINIFRDPRWGRGMETYGEDPFLTGKTAVAFIKGMQGDDNHYFKTIATAKHFAVHSGPEPDRHTFDAKPSEYDLRETYLPAFKMCVEDANVQSVMCAYNRVRSKACCGNNPLLTQILRDEWGFKGYVVSDCGAIGDIFQTHKVVKTQEEAAALATKSGTDIECGENFSSLVSSVKHGLVTEDELNIAVKRLFTARMKLGMFDPDTMVKYAHIPYTSLDSKEHKLLALETARKTIVLLKNDKQLLPISKDIKRLAVIGPNANDVEVLLGNYNGIPTNPITPLMGIREKLQKTEILYSQGCSLAENLPTLEPIPSSALYTNTELKNHGLNAEYYDSINFKGEPRFKQIDSMLNFNWWDKAPAEGMNDDRWGVRWTGVLVPKISGKYALGAEGKFGFRVYLDDSLIFKFQSEHATEKQYDFFNFIAGKMYRLKVEFYDKQGDATMKLLWQVPGKDLKKEALDYAKKSDAVIMFMGLSPRLEGEEMRVRVDGFKGGDRLTLDLPRIQEELIKAVSAIHKPLVLVLLNGSAVSINWEKANVPAIVEAWYPGQAGGSAIADVLFGDYNPAGRLPVTFYKSVNDLPSFDNYDMKNRTYRYFDKEVLFPFGYGMSYSTFSYDSVKLNKTEILASESTFASVTVKNTGKYAGEEVVQLYVSNPGCKRQHALKSLKGFQRISLQPGESRKVSFAISSDILSNFDEKSNAFLVDPGDYFILIGKSSSTGDLQKSVLTVKQ
jgi:beta-glucosidase